MSTDAVDYSRSKDTYFQQTHRPINSLVFLLPMLLVFHLGTLLVNTKFTLKGPRDLEHLAQMLVKVGPLAGLLPAVLVVLVLLLMQFSRHEKWTVQKRALAGMTAESVLWMMPLLAIVMLTGRLLLAAQEGGNSLIQGVILACGAGIYEEFLFRLLMIGGAVAVLTKLMGLKRSTVAFWAALASAVLFSLYHFGDRYGFVFSHFVIRMMAGLYLAGLYVFRGFGIAVGAHAAYDIYAALNPQL